MMFVFGSLFGSFFNVCIYRIPRGVPLALPPSHCYQCGRRIRWFDNIPLISYWALGGRCRYCKIPFSMRYFGIELLTAGLFAIVFMRYCSPAPEIGYSLVIFPGIILTSFLIISSFTDIDHWIIPLRTSLGGAVAGVGLSLIPPLARSPHNPLADRIDLVDDPLFGTIADGARLGLEAASQGILPAWMLAPVHSLAGAVIGFSLLWFIGFVGTLIFRKEAMGRGDMNLFAMFGAFLGPINCLYVLIIGCFLGSIFGITGIVLARIARNRALPASIAPLKVDAMRADILLDGPDLSPVEKLVLRRAFDSPGSVGAARHHLPFGPSLALAAFAVFLAWEPIKDWFSSAFYVGW